MVADWDGSCGASTRDSYRGHKYIMTVTDYYTKWAEAVALKDKTATSVADVLYSVSIYACKHAFIHEYILVTDNISIHCR